MFEFLAGMATVWFYYKFKDSLIIYWNNQSKKIKETLEKKD